MPDDTKELVETGARYVSIGSDLTFLLNGTTDRVKQFRSTRADR